MITVDNVAALTSLTGISDQQFVTLLGNTTALDGGGQELRYNATGRSGVTIDNRRYYTAGGADDYFKTATEVYDVPYLRSLPADAKETVRMDEGVHTVDADLTLGDGVVLKVPNGAMFSVDSGMTLLIHGEVDAGQYQIFDGDGDVKFRQDIVNPPPWIQSGLWGMTTEDFFTTRQLELNVLWFAGDELGVKINQCILAGMHNTVIRIPPGIFDLSTTVYLDGNVVANHIVIEGASFLATTITIQAYSGIIGFDMTRGNECEIRNLCIVEGENAHTAMCVCMGGTDNRLRNCWISNAKYAVYAFSLGARITECIIEYCEYGIFVSSYHEDSTITGLSEVATTSLVFADNVRIVACAVHLIHIAAYRSLAVTVDSGSWATGDTFTCDQTGESHVVANWNATDSEICCEVSSGPIETTNTLTNDTQTGTATVTSAPDRSGALRYTRMLGVSCNKELSSTKGMGAYLSGDWFTLFDGQILSNIDNGLESYSSRLLKISGSFTGNEGTGIKLTDGQVLIDGVVCGAKAKGNTDPDIDQVIDIDATDCDLKITGCQLDSVTPFTGMMQNLEVSGSGLTVTRHAQFNGTDAYVTAADAAGFYAANNTITMKFNLLKVDYWGEFGDPVNQVIFATGLDPSNWMAVGIYQGFLRFLVNTASVIRAIASTAELTELGEWSCTYTKGAAAGSALSILTPSGDPLIDNSTFQGIFAQTTGFAIGNRGTTPTQFFGGIASDFRLYDSAGVLSHQWPGTGELDSDWLDQVGSAHGTITGTIATSRTARPTTEADNVITRHNSSTATPVGAVTPSSVGEMHLDTTLGDWWISTGMSNTDWKKITA